MASTPKMTFLFLMWLLCAKFGSGKIKDKNENTKKKEKNHI
jgi:hypothetical protein